MGKSKEARTCDFFQVQQQYQWLKNRGLPTDKISVPGTDNYVDL